MSDSLPTSFTPAWDVPPGSYFVTGTDTGVGKTWVSAMLMLAHARAGRSAGYMKPVQTGCVQRGEQRMAPDVEWVSGISGFHPPAELEPCICPYRFLLPASPHLAAARENAAIAIESIRATYQQLVARYPIMIVEGAGGVQVPLSEQLSMLDLMQMLQLPVLVVSRPVLGTLNHTLLTINALRAADLDVRGIVLVQSQPPPVDAIAAQEEEWIVADNQRMLESWSGLPIMGRLPYQENGADSEVTRQACEQILACS